MRGSRCLNSTFSCSVFSSRIVALIAFHPPPSSYSIVYSADGSKCNIQVCRPLYCRLPAGTDSSLTVFLATTRHRSRIVCVFVRALNSPPKPLPIRSHSFPITPHASGRLWNVFSDHDPVKRTYTILFSHGNATDIGQILLYLRSFANRYGVNVMCYDYSGYGASTGRCSEEHIYADAEAVLEELLNRYKIPLDRIVLYGHSIGTAPTVHLAIQYKVAAVVLQSPLMSGFRFLFPNLIREYRCDPFANLHKVSRILSPTLIIHGTRDKVIGVHHGYQLFFRLTHALTPAWIDGAGHNNLHCFPQYNRRLRHFFTRDLLCAGSNPPGSGISNQWTLAKGIESAGMAPLASFECEMPDIGLVRNALSHPDSLILHNNDEDVHYMEGTIW